ncbi:MAG: outer membrane protein transport protein [Hahellaceae bacterium]|nr:outer membrane protein transport protein [Hahellaceae bacterium]
MKKTTYKFRKIGLAAVCACISSGTFAQMTQNLAIDSKALALGNAVTADPPGIKSIHYNPAGLAKLKGRQFELGLLNAYMDIDAEFIAPPGYNIFGIDGSKDPVANSHSHTNTLALYIPGIGLQKMPFGGPALAPSMGFSINLPGSKFTFGNAVYMPMVAGFWRSQSDPGRYQPKAAALQRFTYLSPTVGYEINDQWSVGFGVHLSHFGIAADQFMRAPNMLLGVTEVLQEAFNCESGNEPLAPFIALCGGNVGPWDDIGAMSLKAEESISPTYAVGVLWEPTDWFSWGASYTSDADMKLKGTFELNYTDDWSGFWQGVNGSIMGAIGAAILSLPSGVPRETGNITINHNYPQHFQTGISVKVHPMLTINTDLGWTDFKNWDALHIQFDRKLEFLGAAKILSPDNVTDTSLSLPMGMTDEWNVGIGAELHVSSRLDLRAGVEFRDSVIPDNQRNLMAPFGGANLYGVGLGYQWSKDTVIDANISYVQSVEYIPANGSCNINCDNLTNLIYNPYAGLDVKTSLRFAAVGVSFRTAF